MASQSTIRVESIKVPDGRYKQSRKETPRELYTDHFSPSVAEVAAWEGQAAKPESIYCSQAGLGTIQKGHISSLK
jgi:hypothetical protein